MSITKPSDGNDSSKATPRIDRSSAEWAAVAALLLVVGLLLAVGWNSAPRASGAAMRGVDAGMVAVLYRSVRPAPVIVEVRPFEEPCTLIVDSECRPCPPCPVFDPEYECDQ